MSKGRFLNEKIADLKKLHPKTFKAITSLFDDESSVMGMISAYGSNGNPDEFDELLSFNVFMWRA